MSEMSRPRRHWLCRLCGHQWVKHQRGWRMKFTPPICFRCGFDPDLNRKVARHAMRRAS